LSRKYGNLDGLLKGWLYLLFTFHRKPSKILARKGVKQVGAVMPTERVSLITTAVVVSTSGITLLQMDQKAVLDLKISQG
jgi:hypothetical protein